MVPEPSVFESGCVHGRRDWIKLVMAVGARNGLDHGLSSLRMGWTERKDVQREVLVSNGSERRYDALNNSSDSDIQYPCLCYWRPVAPPSLNYPNSSIPHCQQFLAVYSKY